MLFIIIAIAVLGADLATKHLVFQMMLSPARPDVEIFGKLMSFSRATNTGGPFGLFGAYGNVFFIMAMIFIVGLMVYRIATGRQGRFMDICLGLLLGGALGNWVDRIMFGHVRDFVNFHFWPVFNLADAAITAGVVMLMVFIMLDGFRPQPQSHADVPVPEGEPE